MKLFTLSKNQRLIEAVKFANEYMNSTDFIRDILSNKKYDHANVTSDFIAGFFQGYNKEIEVKLTNFGWFFRNVMGRTVGDGFVYVNSYGIDRQIWQVGATVVHEACHIVDEHFPEARFGHGSNSARGKGMTFPYFIDEKAEDWIKAEVLKKEVNRLSMKKVLNRELLA